MLVSRGSQQCFPESHGPDGGHTHLIPGHWLAEDYDDGRQVHSLATEMYLVFRTWRAVLSVFSNVIPHTPNLSILTMRRMAGRKKVLTRAGNGNGSPIPLISGQMANSRMMHVELLTMDRSPGVDRNPQYDSQ